MEIPDIVVINKSDLPHAAATAAAVHRALSLAPRRDWKAPVITTAAAVATGVDEPAALLDQHRAHLRATGELERRRDRNLRSSVISIALTTWQTRVERSLARDRGETAFEEVADPLLDPASVAERIRQQTPVPGARGVSWFRRDEARVDRGAFAADGFYVRS